MMFHLLGNKIIQNVMFASICIACFSSCSKSEHKTIDDLLSEKNFKINKVEKFDLEMLNDDFLKTLKKVENPLRKKLEPIGDTSYFYSLQSFNDKQIEFTTIEVFEEINETYIIYRIMNRNLIQTASFPVSAIGGEGGSSVLGKGKLKDIHHYMYSEANHDESEGFDSLNILYTITGDGKIKIDTTYKTHRKND